MRRRLARRPMRRSRHPAGRRNFRPRARQEGGQCWRCRLSRLRPLARRRRRRLALCCASRLAPIASIAFGGGHAPLDRRAAVHQSFRRPNPRLFRRRHYARRISPPTSLASAAPFRRRAQHRLCVQGQECRCEGYRQGARRSLRVVGRFSAARSESSARQRTADRRQERRTYLGRRCFDKRLYPTFSACRTRSSPAQPVNWGPS